MIYSIVQLAQGRGRITIRRDFAWQRSAGDSRGDAPQLVLTGNYVVTRHEEHGEGELESTLIPLVEGEELRDTKARAIAAVRMLGYWPELRAEIATERLLARGYVTMPRAVDTLDAFGQVTESGLILPGAP